MREVKFRAWDRVLGICEVKSICFEHGRAEAFPIIDRDYNGPSSYTLNIENANLMQYTGLKDKKGKEIYEGDICKWTGEGNLISGNIFTISWVEKRAAWYLGDCLRPVNMTSVKVIGNIYENPELLGKPTGSIPPTPALA
jgi:uncharacterized phage protein (TIGR01671 family)